MYRQLQKLAVICNICFWCTLVFQLWEDARNIPESILNSIVILGISALVGNIIAVAAGLYSRKKNPNHQKISTWMKWLIVISLLVQIVWLGFTWRSQMFEN